MEPAVLNEERVPEDAFGTRLAIVRQKMGWNISEAARECGLKAATWTTWEEGPTLPRNIYEVCESIAARTRYSYEWLLNGGPLVPPAGVRNRCTFLGELRLIPGGRGEALKTVQMALPLFARPADN